MSNMRKKQTPVAEATTPAPYYSDAPKKDLFFDPETGEFYEVTAGQGRQGRKQRDNLLSPIMTKCKTIQR